MRRILWWNFVFFFHFLIILLFKLKNLCLMDWFYLFLVNFNRKWILFWFLNCEIFCDAQTIWAMRCRFLNERMNVKVAVERDTESEKETNIEVGVLLMARYVMFSVESIDLFFFIFQMPRPLILEVQF